VLKELTYMFTYSRTLEDYSVLARVLVASTTIALLMFARFLSRNIAVEVVKLALILSFELYLTSRVRETRGVLAGLKLILAFTIIGALVFYLSYLLGWLAPNPIEIVPGALRLVAFFLGFSLLFQLMSLREWRSILSKLGFKGQALAFSMAISQIPTTLYYLSEATTTIKLKYKGRRPYKIAVPLALLSLLTSRSLAESYTIYGPPAMDVKLTMYKKKDIYLYLSLAALVATVALIDVLPL
jgi:hypothetical protein